MEQKPIHTHYSFPKKVWITCGIAALMVVLLLLLKQTFSVLLLILAGSLIALFFRGVASLIERKTKWKPGLCLFLSVFTSLLILILLLWLIGSKVAAQATELSNTLPATVEKAKSSLNQTPLGKKLVEKISSPQSLQKAKQIAGTLFRSTFGVLGDMYVVLFIGLFFTVSPQLYKKGIIKLAPPKGKRKTELVLEQMGTNLQKWLKGKLFAMLVVFILTAVGLAIIGIPMWLTLALLAAILNFIPNFGPLIAMVPAVLVALMQGPQTAMFVAGLYIVVQVAESNFITPSIQKKLIEIPPAIIIIAQLFMGVLTGGWGLILATPLVVIIMVIVQETYIKNQEA